MKSHLLKQLLRTTASVALAGSFIIGGALMTDLPAQAANEPALVITNEPLPQDLESKIYSTPRQRPDINPGDIMGESYYRSVQDETAVGRKITQFRSDLFDIQGKVAELSERLVTLERAGQKQAGEYYASVATINAQLQTGSTPGNPRLVKKLETARYNLEELSRNIADLNALAVETSNAASMSAFLLESVQSAYSLKGAVEEDHVRLAQLEDAINNTVVVIDRLLNNISDDVTRTVAYMSSERENLRALTVAINTGDLLGKSLSKRPFSSARQADFTMQKPQGAHPTESSAQATQAAKPTKPSGHRPLVKIRFDRPDVAYEQPVYMAVNEALSRYPDARFELVAIHPSQGNAAQVAIESTKARRNAEKVLRSLGEMGLEMNRVDLSYMPSEKVASNEVHLYIH